MYEPPADAMHRARSQPYNAAISGDVRGTCPGTLRVLGAPIASSGSSNIAGEYTLLAAPQGRACYRQVGSNTTIYFNCAVGRWVFDRNGVTNSDVCVAYADDPVGFDHPGHPGLVWCVWDGALRAHERDDQFMVTDAPLLISVLGRLSSHDNSTVNGEYELASIHHGRPAYQKVDADVVIKYDANDGRWLLGRPTDSGNVCTAFADALNTLHPGNPALEWHFWDTQRRNFVLDPLFCTVVAPKTMQVLGSPNEGERAPFCGTYHLAGVNEGHPVYVRPGTQTVIRHSSRSDRWLIDTQGLTEPSLMSKLYQWILKGDAAAARDRCSAYAEGMGTSNPAHVGLQWHVLDTHSGRHVPDPWLCVTTAPLQVQVQGPNYAEVAGLYGDYVAVGTFAGRAAYQKPGSTYVIRFFERHSRWVLDSKGLRDSDQCSAYADSGAGSESPIGCRSWCFFDSPRGVYIEEPRLSIVPLGEEPMYERQRPMAFEEQLDPRCFAAGGSHPVGFGQADACTWKIREASSYGPLRGETNRWLRFAGA